MAYSITTGPDGAAARRWTEGPEPAALARAAGLVNAVLCVAIAALVTAMPVVAHAAHPALGFLMVVALTGACAWRLPDAALVAVVFAFLFQNLFVSLISGSIDGKEEFDVIRAYNFLILCVVWIATALRYLALWRVRDRALDPYVKMSVALMAVIGLYFLAGFALYGMTAIVYLRNIVTPLLFFHICLLLFALHPVRLGPALSLVGLLVIACGLVEFWDREAWLTYTNGYAYWELAGGANWMTLAYDKEAADYGRVATGLLDSFKVDFLNTPLLADLGGEILRLFGPNMHSISFGYGLSFLAVFSLFRGRFGQAALLLLLGFLCNAKGPLILLLVVSGGWLVFRLFGAGLAFAAVCAVLAVYVAAGIVVGLGIGDFHVIGLMAGIQDFFRNPVGYGVGAGGNLSPAFFDIDWYAAQAAGRTPFAVESSVGVLLYQMGVFAFALIGFYVWLSWRLVSIARLTGNDLHAAASFALLAVIANGLFQEEAYFAPLALALFTGLAGMILGAAARTGLQLRDRR